MTNKEIQQKAKNLLEQIDDEIRNSNSIFVYNPRIDRLETELAALQMQCKHKFEDKMCIYCGAAQKEDKEIGK